MILDALQKVQAIAERSYKTKQRKNYIICTWTWRLKQEMHEEKGKTYDYKYGNELKCILTGLLQERNQLSNMWIWPKWRFHRQTKANARSKQEAQMPMVDIGTCLVACKKLASVQRSMPYPWTHWIRHLEQQKTWHPSRGSHHSQYLGVKLSGKILTWWSKPQLKSAPKKNWSTKFLWLNESCAKITICLNWRNYTTITWFVPIDEMQNLGT